MRTLSLIRLLLITSFTACMAATQAAGDVRWAAVKPGVLEDGVTKTQWTQRDNGIDIRKAVLANSFCVHLELDGGGWVLPSTDELAVLFSSSKGSRIPCGGEFRCQAPKLFDLTGPRIWSSTEQAFFLTDGSTTYLQGINGNKLYRPRALCVRHTP
jgi:hypothetical protein